MKALKWLSLVLLLLAAACQGWPWQPDTYNPSTPPPSRTPRVQTPTPLIVYPASSTPFVSTVTDTPGPTATITPTGSFPFVTDTPTVLVTQPAISLSLVILGCETSIDVLHGMGEVTNAYVTISNRTSSDVTNLCATLRGLDEGRTHPDKTKCVPSLPTGFQVTEKLTVDTTYKAETPIQVDLTTGDTLLLRAGEPACQAIGLILPDVGTLGAVVPIP
ncbi:MAG: hypothetical protein ACM3MF_09115 [Anaerolineae bacterium]